MRCAGNMHSSYYKWNMAIICNPPIMLCATFVPCFFRSTGPIAVARRRSVCPSVNICNSATYVRIFFKIGVNIPWVNITRRFFHFCKILNFLLLFFNFKKFKSLISQYFLCIFSYILAYIFLRVIFINYEKMCARKLL